MSQITLYLDTDTEALVEKAAKASGLSRSRWVADLIRRHAPGAWSPECLALAGTFADFPLRETEPAGASVPAAADVARLGF